MKGRKIEYSDAEMTWLEANRAMVIGDYHRAFVARFGRDDVSAQNLHALRKRRGWKTGRTGRFQKGMVPANKGKPMPYNANSARTRFRKGNRTGKANENYKPIGTERISKDGYVERKMHDGLPMQSRWRAVHVINWEAANGPVPEGHCLKCLDGDKANTDPSNWTCIPRALLPRLAGRWTQGYDDADPRLKPLILAAAELDHAARTRRKAAQ